jgi:Xaa-Pro aminopeptidase
VSERTLLGVYLSTIASLGAPTPPSEAVFGRPTRDRGLEAGEVLVLNVGARWAGYEGVVGRSIVAGREPPLLGVGAALDDVIAACRPGIDAEALAGPGVTIHGLGLGMEPPVVGWGAPVRGETLREGMVLWVGVTDPVSGAAEGETVLIGSAGAEVLSRAPRGRRSARDRRPLSR